MNNKSEKKQKENEKKEEIVPNQPSPQPVPKKKWSFFNKITVVLIAYIAYSQIKPYFTPKNPELEHFANDLEEGQLFDVSFNLIDTYEKSSDHVYKERQVPYKRSWNGLNFTMNINQTLFTADPERFRLETQIVYNSKKLGHVKLIGCASQLSKMMPLKLKKGKYYDSVQKDEVGADEPHVLTKIYCQLVFDTEVYDFTEDEIVNHLYQKSAKKRTLPLNKTDYYFPYVDCTNYWTLQRDKLPIKDFKNNETIPIKVEFSLTSASKHRWAFKFYIAENTNMPYLNDIKMLEEFKMILSDNGFYYLVILFSVNILHSLFSVLSMKNNLSFFSNLKSTQGISTRKHFTDIVFTTIITLYLIENDTSIVVIILSCFEILMSIYIVIKMAKFERREDGKFPFFQFPKSEKQEENETDQYDREATSLLSKIFFPILGIYYIYSFWTAEKVNYYPFILKNLVTFIHAVGFINMTPQVYINYKLKSVEFMPWKGMIYQFLNTIVDDLFAFAVKMPTLQRIAVFRDDVIFCIYLYQKWIYRKNVRKDIKEE